MRAAAELESKKTRDAKSNAALEDAKKKVRKKERRKDLPIRAGNGGDKSKGGSGKKARRNEEKNCFHSNV